MCGTRPRAGSTLLECLAVMGILSIMIGLLIPAVQNVRGAARRADSANRLRQLALSVHLFGGDRDGKVPTINGGARKVELPDIGAGKRTVTRAEPPVLAYLQHIVNPAAGFSGPIRAEPFYIGPGDPSAGEPRRPFPSSFSANAWVFETPLPLAGKVGDGTSNTFMFAERYSRCGEAAYSFTTFEKYLPDRRATFADGGPILGGKNVRDVYPITANGRTEPSVPGLTFQVRPTFDLGGTCDSRILQTAYPGGLPVAYCDGSVRTVRVGVTPSVFWSAVTIAGGEIAGAD